MIWKIYLLLFKWFAVCFWHSLAAVQHYQLSVRLPVRKANGCAAAAQEHTKRNANALAHKTSATIDVKWTRRLINFAINCSNVFRYFVFCEKTISYQRIAVRFSTQSSSTYVNENGIDGVKLFALKCFISFFFAVLQCFHRKLLLNSELFFSSRKLIFTLATMRFVFMNASAVNSFTTKCYEITIFSSDWHLSISATCSFHSIKWKMCGAKMYSIRLKLKWRNVVEQ